MAVEVIEHIPNVHGKPYFLVSDKEINKVTYKVERSNDGYIFYKVTVDVGKVPPVLDQMFTKFAHGIKAVTDYLEHQPKSPTVRRDENTKAREERKQLEAK